MGPRDAFHSPRPFLRRRVTMTTLRRRTSAVPAALLVGLLAFLPLARRAPAGPANLAEGDEAAAVYTPNMDDFRPEYDRDTVNSRVQTWNQYWGWVSDYYRGNIFSVGWVKETNDCLAM